MSDPRSSAPATPSDDVPAPQTSEAYTVLPLPRRPDATLVGPDIETVVPPINFPVYCTKVVRQAAASFMRPDPWPVAGWP
jgi:hypothetical protein